MLILFTELKFINHEVMNDKKRIYGTNNVGHCFSRMMLFPEWLNCLNFEEIGDLDINRYGIHDFMLGNDKTGQVKHKKFYHIPMPIHFVIKHRNLGKIESHKWFFKGF